jgi:hypothetical protein
MKYPRYIENLIANLRGIPENMTRSNLGPIQSIDILIGRILKKYNASTVQITNIIMKNWHDIVGTCYSHRCSIQKILNNQLFIRVENATLRTELAFQKKNILERLQSIPGCEHFIDIVFLSM